MKGTQGLQKKGPLLRNDDIFQNETILFFKVLTMKHISGGKMFIYILCKIKKNPTQPPPPTKLQK